MKYEVILRNGNYALLDMGYQFVVVSGFDSSLPEGQQWDNGTYYSHWNQGVEDKQKALFEALELFRMRTEFNFIPRCRIEELATRFKDGLIDADKDLAMEFFDSECEMTDEEKEWFGIETESEGE